MATTTSANMIVPEVWADMVQGRFKGALVLGNLAITDTTLEGVPGDTVNFPKWNALADADDLAEAVPMVPEALTTDPGNQATIKEAGKAVELTDRARLVAFGDPYAETQRQLGTLIARKIDTDLRIAAETGAPRTVAHDGPLSWSAMVKGIALFGDEWDPADMAGIVVHSAQHAALLNDPNFISADKIGAGNGVLLRGQVGAIGNVPVIVSDRTTRTEGVDPAPDTYNALLIRRGALGLLYKRRPVVETDRDILKRTTVVTTNVHYATHRMDDEGIVVLTTQGAA